MTRSVVRAQVTAAAVTLLICTIFFASAITVDLAVAGLLHLPVAATDTVGAIILAGTAWIGVVLFRRAYAVERGLDAMADSPIAGGEKAKPD